MSSRVKGWCPSAYRPMMSGDGLLVRVRPRMGRLSVDAALQIADLADRFGNGMIDVTARANLQIRGVREADHAELLGLLVAEGLVDADPILESRRSVVVSPFWMPGDVTDRLGQALDVALPGFPDLPDKMGYAIDIDGEISLSEVSADLRVERGADGLILRADGATRGLAVTEDTVIAHMVEMLDWFVSTGGRDSGRMARHLKTVPLPKAWQTVAPVSAGHTLQPGMTRGWPVAGVPFGALTAADLVGLIAGAGPRHLRITPWRMLVLEDGQPVEHPAFVTKNGDPILTVSACPGAPACVSASVKTRDIARQLARLGAAGLHVSGCNKGCAHPRPAVRTLVGRDGHFDLVENGRASDTPVRTTLTESALMELFP